MSLRTVTRASSCAAFRQLDPRQDVLDALAGDFQKPGRFGFGQELCGFTDTFGDLFHPAILRFFADESKRHDIAEEYAKAASAKTRTGRDGKAEKCQ